MRSRLQHLRHDERGISFVYVGVGFLSFMAASTLAIDIGMFMTARSQAQNAADAGALAGAVALAFNDYNDRSPGGPAVQSAINAAQANTVIRQIVDVTPDDVEFLTGPSGLNNRVRVTVYRTASRSNPLATIIGPLVNVDTADVTAVATAEAAPANAATCVMPFTIPDKWNENTNGPWTPDSEFNMYDNKGKPLSNPDQYIAGPNGTGYNAQRDKGLELTLKADNGSKVSPSFYNPWALPGGNGASYYEENIAGCNTSIIPLGHAMTPEPGNMTGPTAHGVERLIAKDPNAWWDTTCNCVKGSDFGKSPRVAMIPLYDPVYYEEGKQTGRNASLKVANYLGFFIVGMRGNEVIGRITPVTGLLQGNPGPNAGGAFPMAIRLVE